MHTGIYFQFYDVMRFNAMLFLHISNKLSAVSLKSIRKHKLIFMMCLYMISAYKLILFPEQVAYNISNVQVDTSSARRQDGAVPRRRGHARVPHHLRTFTSLAGVLNLCIYI